MDRPLGASCVMQCACLCRTRVRSAWSDVGADTRSGDSTGGKLCPVILRGLGCATLKTAMVALSEEGGSRIPIVLRACIAGILSSAYSFGKNIDSGGQESSKSAMGPKNGTADRDTDTNSEVGPNVKHSIIHS